MSFSNRSTLLSVTHRQLALALIFILCQLTLVVETARSAQIESQPGLSPPTELQTVGPPLKTENSGSAILHVGAVLLVGCAISSAGLRLKYRRFIGLGVFTNWYSFIFILIGALLCSFPRTLVNALASFLTPSGASWTADSAGIMLTLLFGMKVRSLKSSLGTGAVQDLENPAGSNVIFAVIEEGIRDQLLTRMQLVLIEYAHRYTWEAIEVAGHRTIDEEVAIGRLSRKDGDAGIESIKALRSPRDQKTAADRRYRALVRLLSFCPLSRLRRALTKASGATA